MSKEYIIDENLSVCYAYNCYHIQVVDTTLILNSYDWELFKLMLLDIINKCIKHHKEKGFLDSNEIEKILFKKNEGR